MIRFGWFDNVKPWINPFTPGSDQFQISLTASPEILHHTLWRTWLFPGYSERSLYTTNSHYLTHTFLLKGWENVLFEIGRERLNEVISWQCASISFDFRHFCSGAWPESGVGSRQRNFWLCRRNQVQYRQLATVRKCHGRIGRRQHFEGPWRVDGLGALQGHEPSDRWGQQWPVPRLSTEGWCAGGLGQGGRCGTVDRGGRGLKYRTRPWENKGAESVNAKHRFQVRGISN